MATIGINQEAFGPIFGKKTIVSRILKGFEVSFPVVEEEIYTFAGQNVFVDSLNTKNNSWMISDV